MIEKFGRDAGGFHVLEGRYAIHPAGHLIVIPPKAPLKDGFRWATQDEVDGKQAEPEAAHEPAATHELTSE